MKNQGQLSRRQILSAAGFIGLATLTVGLYSVIGGAFSAILTLWLNLRRKEPAITD